MRNPTATPTVVPTIRMRPFSIDAPVVPRLMITIASPPYFGSSQFIHRASQ